MKCPFCDAPAFRRRGVHFDHEYLCTSSDCRETFSFDEIEDLLDRLPIAKAIALAKILAGLQESEELTLKLADLARRVAELQEYLPVSEAKLSGRSFIVE